MDPESHSFFLKLWDSFASVVLSRLSTVLRAATASPRPRPKDVLATSPASDYRGALSGTGGDATPGLLEYPCGDDDVDASGAAKRCIECECRTVLMFNGTVNIGA